MKYFFTRWRAPGGYAEFLAVALPLIISTSLGTLQQFINRIFLSWSGADAIAASLPAGILNFATVSFFIGVAGYASTFVAQYTGARQDRRIGPVVWQGVYIALAGGLLHLALIPAAGPLFGLFDHPAGVQTQEVIYYRLLCVAALPGIMAAALSSFYSGLGRTWPVLWVNLTAVIINVVLDYVLIFGKAGFPAMGITGAGIATIIAGTVACALFLILMLKDRHERDFATRSGWRPDPPLMRRLLRFGLPAGAQFALDIALFAAFILIVGRLGLDELAATNIAFSINMLAFMPMIGCGIAVSILTGQHLGADHPELAARSTWSAFHLTLAYTLVLTALYIAVPQLFITLFQTTGDPGDTLTIGRLATVLLRFVAFYSLFDTMNIIFASTLKGAGDTRFVMVMLGVIGTGGLIIPSIIVIYVLGLGVYAAWTVCTVYIILLGFAFLARFLNGAWRAMRVIEPDLVDSIPTAGQ